VTPSPEDIIQAIYDAAEKGLRVVVTNGSPPTGPVELGPASLAALEEVQVNVTGEGGISTESTLAALLALLTPGVPEQSTGSVGVTPQTISFSGPTKHVTVYNPEFSGTVEVSFDGGSTFTPIAGRGQLSFPCRVSSLQIRSGGGTQDYAVVGTV